LTGFSSGRRWDGAPRGLLPTAAFAPPAEHIDAISELRCAAGTVTAPQPVTFPQSVVKGLLASLLFALPALVTGRVEVQGGAGW